MSHTRSAVDNIVLRLRAGGLPVLRLGRADSVHASLRDCLPGGSLWPDTSVAKLRSLARCAGVVRYHNCCCCSCMPILAAGRYYCLQPRVHNCCELFSHFTTSSGLVAGGSNCAWRELAPAAAAHVRCRDRGRGGPDDAACDHRPPAESPCFRPGAHSGDQHACNTLHAFVCCQQSFRITCCLLQLTLTCRSLD